MSYLWFISLLLLLKLIPNLVFTVKLQTSIPIESKRLCKIQNDNYYKVIQQFYGSMNLISFFFIHPNKPNALSFDLSNHLLLQISKSKYFS